MFYLKCLRFMQVLGHFQSHDTVSQVSGDCDGAVSDQKDKFHRIVAFVSSYHALLAQSHISQLGRDSSHFSRNRLLDHPLLTYPSADKHPHKLLCGYKCLTDL
jgi:hypothetical protein